jgi:hypothetical protein
MLHYTLLPDHASWKRFFSNLRFIVIDEAHHIRITDTKDDKEIKDRYNNLFNCANEVS